MEDYKVEDPAKGIWIIILIIFIFGAGSFCYVAYFESDDAECLDMIADKQCIDLGYETSTSDYNVGWDLDFHCLSNRELSPQQLRFTEEDKEKCKRGIF